MAREWLAVKVTKHGNSYHVSIPAVFRHALGIVCGDTVLLELYRGHRAVVIRNRHDVSPVNPLLNDEPVAGTSPL